MPTVWSFVEVRACTQATYSFRTYELTNAAYALEITRWIFFQITSGVEFFPAASHEQRVSVEALKSCA